MSEMGLSSESTAKALCGMTFLRFAMSISEPASFRLYVSNGYNVTHSWLWSSILWNGESSKTYTSATIAFVCAG